MFGNKRYVTEDKWPNGSNRWRTEWPNSKK